MMLGRCNQAIDWGSELEVGLKDSQLPCSAAMTIWDTSDSLKAMYKTLQWHVQKPPEGATYIVSLNGKYLFALSSGTGGWDI